MAIFNITITDTRKLAGVTAARVAYNTANVSVAGFAPIAVEADYVQFVMDSAATSYATQYKV